MPEVVIIGQEVSRDGEENVDNGGMSRMAGRGAQPIPACRDCRLLEVIGRTNIASAVVALAAAESMLQCVVGAAAQGGPA